MRGAAASLRSALLCVFVCGAFHSALAHSPGVDDQDQAAAHEVEAFREFVKRAVDAKDIHALRILYADSFTHTHGSGRMDGKDTRIVSVMAGEPLIENAPADDIRFRVHGEHTIIVTGRSPILNTKENKTYQFRWMAVYVKQGQDWKLAASQATRLP
ncbi:hypothetical protein GJW-30_1_03409 [Variibacter gotjawalensis]|uniref:DUF4440 domain-containing protein n=1 Tax=Variibacter gotjawalensis TaxID=1333996 RepID=A0A0S3PY72_9BRAD|nr:nuclear transport factor 2 family protein [Variibacter gotjawalensis]NIK46694.1 ketosteroid isomerase-like protein [Variibacter gotjawalensis]RZS48597.1 uncharacterized protein DUF4440 [Variibacter gotjawalensis]BAT60859.1 hypothetical protein GJW-30_1_03409 [Variibacter gotjawalensis]